MITDPLVHLIPATVDNVNEHLVPAAEKNNAGIWAATHLIVKDEECVGYVSIGALPFVATWMHRTKLRNRECLGVLNFVENHVAATLGSDNLILPVHTGSAMLPFVERLGYVKTEFDYVFIKNLKNVTLKK